MARKIFSVSIFAIVISTVFTFGQINHWETIVNFDSTWSYFPGTAEPDTNWSKLSFNDAAWSQGPGGIGFGDGDDNTTIPLLPSVYLRHTFNVIDTSVILEALLNIDYDDGFIAYLNNVEIARYNLGSAAGDRPPYTQYANGQHEAMMYQGGSAEGFIITKAKLLTCLVPGNNVLAITVHNATAASPDMSSLTWLHIGMSTSGMTYGPNPSWFIEPISSSNLPLVVIDSYGIDINDSIRIISQMGIIDNGPGIRNYLYNPFNDYNGNISIELRGSTSQQYPKKSYGIETQDSIGDNNNVSLLGMPSENDWVLYAPYPDKTLMRNTLAYQLFRHMDHYGSNTRFCEVIINGNYVGVYEFHERIKIDNNRLYLPKLDTDDIMGDSLTGGYIVKIDKTTGTGSPAWTSPFSSNVYFQFHDPEESELTLEQKSYIETFVTDFETALNGPNFADPDLGYRRYIDVQSFMDFMIMQEVGRTVDGYRSSSFFHKQRDSYGGKLSAGPMWDFNLSFGNADYCDSYLQAGWQYEFNTICPGYVPEIPFWWSKFITDPRWSDELRCRWDHLRSGPLNTDSVTAWIDSVATTLDEGQTRNFVRWPILGVYVNWNYYVGNTYQEEIDYLKSWITQRLTWLDSNWPTAPVACNSPGADEIYLTEINYNSSGVENSGDWFELYNNSSSSVDLGDWKFKDSNPDNLFTFPAGTILTAGGYLVVCEDTSQFLLQHPLIHNIIGQTNFNLGNAGDAIHIYDSYYSNVISMRFDDTLPWPLSPDGGGYTLEVLNFAGNPNDAGNWFAGCPEGSPGEIYSSPCAVGLQANGSKVGFSVSPNPFRENPVLRFDESFFDKNASTGYSIYDLTGRLLFNVGHLHSPSNEIPCENLSAGIYFIEIYSGDEKNGYLKMVKE